MRISFRFLSEREAADRNYAIGFYMKENKCYPEKANLKDIMDFYFQVSKSFLHFCFAYVPTNNIQKHVII